MKIIKIVLILAVIVAVAFTCKQQHDDTHNHSADPHVHAGDEAATEVAHSHENEDAAHNSEHETELADDPAHPAADDGHTHDGVVGEHTHGEEDILESPVEDDYMPGIPPIEDEYDPGHPTDMGEAVVADGVIPIDANWETLVGLKTAVAEMRPIEELISVPGRIIPDADKIAVVNPLIESSVNCVMAGIGDRVDKSDELICLVSPQIGVLRAEYDKAKAESKISDKNYQRRKELFEEKIISERAFQETERDKQLADVNFEYARKQLLAVGVSEHELENPPVAHGQNAGSTLHIHAPIAGVITSRNAIIGQKVGSDDRLFEIIDLSNVWCEADIFEKDLKSVRVGQKVRLRVSAFPDDRFIGKIFHVGHTLDNITKTIKVLISINNLKEKLKPGMFSDTYIVTGEKTGVLVIPKAAIMEDENLKVVFVKEASGYHRHVITTGINSDQYVEVLSGISENAVVVTVGAYQLKSKSRMSTVDPHAGHQH